MHVLTSYVHIDFLCTFCLPLTQSLPHVINELVCGRTENAGKLNNVKVISLIRRLPQIAANYHRLPRIIADCSKLSQTAEADNAYMAFGQCIQDFLPETVNTKGGYYFMKKIKGVNLGNWLVLEKWMSPSLFDGTTAEDEYYLPTQLSKEVYEARIRQHRAEYITERDFVTIRSMGLNTVRIPVPYFIFGDRAPFIGCIEDLDHAFSWAERYGLQILIDLHTAPGSQNGFDNGGISGVCKFFQMPEEIEFVYTVLERLAQRYADRPGLWGIEILNEPISQQMWKTTNVPERYKPVDPAMAEGSRGYDAAELRHFYETAYDRIRRYLPEDKVIVIHDGFDFLSWKDFMREEKYRNVVLDTHQYLMVAEAMGCPQTLEGYQQFIKDHFESQIEEMQQYFPVVCGEWCLFNSLACGRDTKGGQTMLNGEMEAITGTVSDEQKKNIYRALDQAQKAAWDKGSGYFFWSYKLLVDTVTTDSWAGWDAWDLGRCVDFGWFEREN